MLKNVLICGSTTMLGKRLLSSLAADDGVAHIVCLNWATEGCQMEEKCIHSDKVKNIFFDDQALFDVVTDAMQNIDEVFYFFRFPTLRLFKKSDSTIFEQNILLTKTLINEAIKQNVDDFFYISSSLFLPIVKEVSEEYVYEPSTNLNELELCNYLSELEVHRGIAEGLKIWLLYPSILLEDFSKAQGITKELYKMWYKKKSPQGTNGFVYAVDVVQILMLLRKKGRYQHKHFFLSAEHLTLQEVYTIFEKLKPQKKSKKDWNSSCITEDVLKLDILDRKTQALNGKEICKCFSKFSYTDTVSAMQTIFSTQH